MIIEWKEKPWFSYAGADLQSVFSGSGSVIQ